MQSNSSRASITVRAIHFATSSYRSQWSVCLKPLHTSTSFQYTQAGQDKNALLCHSLYTGTKVHSVGWKTDKTHTLAQTYIPFFYLDCIGTLLRQGHTVTKAKAWKHAFSLVNILLSTPKTNPQGFTGESGCIDFTTVTNALCLSHKPAQWRPSKAEKVWRLRGFITQWIYNRKIDSERKKYCADLFHLSEFFRDPNNFSAASFFASWPVALSFVRHLPDILLTRL